MTHPLAVRILYAMGLMIAAARATPPALAQDAVTQTGTLVGSGDALRGDAASRRELAFSLVAQRETEGGRAYDPLYRTALVDSLASRSMEQLVQLQLQGGDGPIPNLLGDTSANLVYTPVTPCRVFDTRIAVAGILGAGTQRNFIVAGTGDLSGQGGSASGCGVPMGPATSVIINLVAVAPAGAGNLRAWAVANPQPPAPLAAVINYSPTLTALANGVAVPICDASATSCSAGDLRLQADVSSVHVVADVLGYFSKTTLATSGEVSLSALALPATTTSPTVMLTFSIPALAPGRLFVTADFPLFIDADTSSASSIVNIAAVGLCTTNASSATCGGSYQTHTIEDADNASSVNATDAVSLHRVIPVLTPGPVSLYINANFVGTPTPGATLRSDGPVSITWMLLP